MCWKTGKTARYVCEKIYRFFIGEQVDRSWLDELSDRSHNSNYDISKLHAFHFSR